MNNLPVAVIGGGPVGLAAVAHLLERGEQPILFEAGASIAANVRDWGHVRMFSPWEFNVDAAAVRLLERHGWVMPPADELPTGAELYQRYLRPLAALPPIAAVVHTEAKVIAISRRHTDKIKDRARTAAPFQLHIDQRGSERRIEARAVIDASGSWHRHNPLGANGLAALGERALQGRIAYRIPDILGAEGARYADKRVLVAGSGHSAINALLDLLRLQESHPNTQAVWVMRGSSLQKVFGGGADDALPARGQLGSRIQAAAASGAVEIAAPFPITKVAAENGQLRVESTANGSTQSILADEIIACTGTRPALDMLRELRLDLDPAVESSRALAPLIDPNLHSCGTVPPHGEAELRQPEKDFYIVGMKSYGRAPTFLLATGYEQVRSIAAALTGDWDAARDLQLKLPETGVCITDFAAAESCCAPTAATESYCAPAAAAPPLLGSAEIPILQPQAPCC